MQQNEEGKRALTLSNSRIALQGKREREEGRGGVKGGHLKTWHAKASRQILSSEMFRFFSACPVYTIVDHGQDHNKRAGIDGTKGGKREVRRKPFSFFNKVRKNAPNAMETKATFFAQLA